MKSFNEYLMESKSVYDFKIKIAGDHIDGCAEKIKQALVQFNVESCSMGKRTPIQETHIDFPNHKNINVTTCNITCQYPATSQQIRSLIAETFNLSDECVMVRNSKEEAEDIINHENDEKSGQSLLNQEYIKDNNQELVGEAQKMKLLKELSKSKHQGEQYKGVNDQLLAKKSPSEKGPAAKEKEIKSSSVIGSKPTTRLTV